MAVLVSPKAPSGSPPSKRAKRSAPILKRPRIADTPSIPKTLRWEPDEKLKEVQSYKLEAGERTKNPKKPLIQNFERSSTNVHKVQYGHDSEIAKREQPARFCRRVACDNKVADDKGYTKEIEAKKVERAKATMSLGKQQLSILTDPTPETMEGRKMRARDIKVFIVNNKTAVQRLRTCKQREVYCS